MCGDATTGPALRNACAIVSSRCGPPGPCKIATLCDESGRCCGTCRALSSDVLREYFHLIANEVSIALDRMITNKKKQRHAVHATAVMPRRPDFNTRWTQTSSISLLHCPHQATAKKEKAEGTQRAVCSRIRGVTEGRAIPVK